jgi:hypothetical protein
MEDSLPRPSQDLALFRFGLLLRRQRLIIGRTDKEITGLPSDNGMAMLPTIVERLKKLADIEKGACIQISYVMLRGVSGDNHDRAVFIAGVYGVKQLEFGTQFPDRDEFKIIHYVFDQSGKLIFGSN